MTTPILQTERLILRPLTTKDAEYIYKTWTSDPRVAKYMLYTTHQNSKVTFEWLKTVEDNLDGDNYDWGFELKATGCLIGSGGLYLNDDKSYTIGYNFAFDYWHQGFATEAAKAFVEFAKSIGIKKLISRHAIPNIYSGKVMQKIGMHCLGETTMTRFNGEVFPAIKYELDL